MNTPRMPVWRRLLRMVGRRLFQWAENNGNADASRNGEEWFARSLVRAHAARGATRPWVVVDAGANAGDYSAMLHRFAQAEGCELVVHAFEPSRAARTRLQARFPEASWLRPVAKAVGEREGVAVLHGGASGATHASLIERAGSQETAVSSVEVEVTTLAAYLDGNHIARVDLLKLDIEGFELSALRGLGERLKPDLVAAIQFEYGGTTLDAGVTLRQLYALLEARGYRVAKLLPGGLAVRGYAPWMEHFNYANYVAISPEEFR